MSTSVSVIVTTYNWPEALHCVLRSLHTQERAPCEVLIADDGSDNRTKIIIDNWRAKFNHPLIHVWQEDKGFRAAKARNKAIAQTKNDFVIFLDGDCFVPPWFIKRYIHLVEKGYFVSGNRILLKKAFTDWVLSKQIPVEQWSLLQWIWVWLTGGCNRWSPLLYLPMSTFRRGSKDWSGVRTCNLGVWREDLLQVNGLDEAYTGWGYEDSDLVIRLLRNKTKRKEGRFALPVFHLWHPIQSRENVKENYARLASIQNDSRVKAVQGLDQYI